MWKILKEILRVSKQATIIIPLLEGMYNQIKATLHAKAIQKKADEFFLKNNEKKDDEL